ncbi:MAG: hypothetical protein ACXVGQ_01110 [Mycobacteriaceae bacterium]
MAPDRGYGHSHRKRRALWAPDVERGIVQCWRCGQLILPAEPWDLGHDDQDRTKYRGPEHRRCNRATHLRQGQAIIPTPRASRDW